LSNMLAVGLITSNTADKKLYYEVNQRYEHYLPLKAIFSDNKMEDRPKPTVTAAVSNDWQPYIKDLQGIRIAIASGMLVRGSSSTVDLLLVGDITPMRLKKVVKIIEKLEGRELNYSLLTYDEFYYRLSVRDKFITEVLAGKHSVAVDKDNVLGEQQ